MNQITFVIMVKNGAATLEKTLEALKTWPKVIVVDTGSTDSTLSIAQKFPNVTLHSCPFEGFGKTRNLATAFSSTDWVFHLDADEVVTDKLLCELKSMTLDPQSAYSVFRDNYFLKKPMRGCSGWYPDFVTRLFSRSCFSFGDEAVHEKLACSKKQTLTLKGSLIHTPYQNFGQMLAKMNHYSELFASTTNKKVTLFSPFFHGLFAFIKSYIFKRGFLQGYRGFILSKYIADTSYYKYLKVVEKRFF